MGPILLVTVDTEEEFDWSAPQSSHERSVTNIAELPRVQEMCEALGVRPTYVVDHPVATTESSIAVLRAFLERGQCEVGAHLHPWVNPPLEEQLSRRNSYLCNLPLPLQQRKVAVLTDAIEAAFGCRPTSFKAGRYGFDFRLVPWLVELGYQVDGSVLPYYDLSSEEGPDFGRFARQPFWLTRPLVPEASDRQPMLEIPCTVGFNHRPTAWWRQLHRRLSCWPARRLRLKGLLWHLGIMRRVWLTPEGTNLHDQIGLLKQLGRKPGTILHVTFHSSSIQAGCTPFVRTETDLKALLERLQAMLTFAIAELGARCMTLSECAQYYRCNGQTTALGRESL
jgi:hypothetical protein